MTYGRRSWQEELAIVDRVMRDISGETDPESLVTAYFNGVGDLLPVDDYLSLSRRGLQEPSYRITRYSRFEEHFNPWTHNNRLPLLSGGLLAEIAYADKPVIIEDIPARLASDDPGYAYLQPFQTLIALPQYDQGRGINVTLGLWPAGVEVDFRMTPVMHWQSSLFGRGTHNLVLKNQLATALATLDRELQSVGEIQRSLLPETLPEIAGFDLAAFYRTSARAGGDYYDFFPLPDGAWGMFIADVSGHGTPAAVLMAITHAIAHAQPGTHTPPVELLAYLNEHLVRSYTRGGTFVTAFYAVLDPKRRTLTYSSAGHNPPRLVRGDRVIPLDREGDLPLGIEPTQTYREVTIAIEPGDLLLLYTDGITESMAPIDPVTGSRAMYGEERLDLLLIQCVKSNGSAQSTINCVRADVATFAHNAPPADDQTLIAIRCIA